MVLNEMQTYYEKLKKEVKTKLEPDIKRYIHTLGVMETAIKLAKIHNVEEKRVIIAALLHDVTKLYNFDQNKEIILNYYDESILLEYNENLLHAFSAKIIAKKEFGIEDKDILNAIECHTIGKPNMNMIEKIIFISDYIEPNRTYRSCVKVRNIAFENIDKAVATAINDSIKFYEKRKSKIPKIAYQALDFYNKFLEE